MNARKLAKRSALALSVGLVLMTFGGMKSAAAATLTVGNVSSLPCTGTFPTISAAVAAAAVGDTILVCPGTYPERVNVTKTLTIRGARFGVDARDPSRTGLPATESVVTGTGNGGETAFYLTANNVVIDGFTVEGATSATTFGFGIVLGAGTSGAQIINNIVQNNIAGLSLANNPTGNPALIQHNLFRTNNQPGPVSGTGIYSDQFNAGGNLSNVSIDSNTFTGNNNVAVLLGSTQAGTQSNISISNNIMTGNGNGILLFNITSSSIRKNTITTSVGSQVVLGGGVNGLLITENIIQNGTTRGIRIGDFGGGATNSNITVNCNSISGNPTAGLEIDDSTFPGYTGILDATLNWWGSPTGPTIASNPGGTGDKIIDPDTQVIYRPFLTSGVVVVDQGAPGFQCPTPTKDLLVNYFAGANGARPDQTVRITNTGTATDPAGSTTSDLCANIYVFRNDQQLAECCSCLVTPNGLRTLSVDFDLAHNALTPGAIGEGVIKIVSSQVPTGGCTPALAGSAYASLPGILAWGTHNQDVSGGLQGAGVVNAVTETPFSPATLSQAELKGLQNNCAFIRNQGSGHGICLCGRGD